VKKDQLLEKLFLKNNYRRVFKVGCIGIFWVGFWVGFFMQTLMPSFLSGLYWYFLGGFFHANPHAKFDSQR